MVAQKSLSKSERNAHEPKLEYLFISEEREKMKRFMSSIENCESMMMSPCDE